MELMPFTPYVTKPTLESRQVITRQILVPSDEMTDLIVKGLIQIIAMEGPTLSTRAFAHYAKKGGMVKMTPMATQRFSAALEKAKRDGKILMEPDTTINNGELLLWLPSMKRVVLREYGNRGFADIPASELGEVMFNLVVETDAEKPEIFHKIAELYGLKQLPKNATARLELVYREYLA